MKNNNKYYIITDFNLKLKLNLKFDKKCLTMN